MTFKFGYGKCVLSTFSNDNLQFQIIDRRLIILHRYLTISLSTRSFIALSIVKYNIILFA